MSNAPNWANRTIWTGDNLDIMRGMNSQSVDLIYLDPPFNSKQDYAAPIGSDGAIAGFKDTWTLSDIDITWLDLLEAKHKKLHRIIEASLTNSDKSYLIYMAVRLLEMQRLLKPTGSIYLHCDPTMSHYLKLVMDAIWGRWMLRRELIWSNGDQSGFKSKAQNWIRGHDTVLYYADQKSALFNKQYLPLDDKTLKRYDKIDEHGRRYKIYNKGKDDERFSYLRADRGAALSSVWTDIPSFQKVNNTGEMTGYPTQKPVALLDRIIKASSNKNDIVFDPFCGCATTLVSADRLQRQWIGIDISKVAVSLVKKRIKEDQGLFQSIVPRTDIPKRTDLGPLRLYKSIENKKHLYGEQEGRCNGCRELFDMRHFHVDHIIARAKGGTDHIENLQLLCGHCNSVKGDRTMEYLINKLTV